MANAGGVNAYGFAEVPTNVGSGGGDDTDIALQQGGRGGGAIWLGTYSATGTLSFGTLGAVTANGENGTSGQAGGGAGGTVYIDVGTIDVYVDVIASPLALVVNVTGATILPVGGGLSNARALLAAIDDAVRERTLRRFPQPIVVPAECRMEPGLIGAALLGLEAAAAAR